MPYPWLFQYTVRSSGVDRSAACNACIMQTHTVLWCCRKWKMLHVLFKLFTTFCAQLGTLNIYIDIYMWKNGSMILGNACLCVRTKPRDQLVKFGVKALQSFPLRCLKYIKCLNGLHSFKSPVAEVVWLQGGTSTQKTDAYWLFFTCVESLCGACVESWNTGQYKSFKLPCY